MKQSSPAGDGLLNFGKRLISKNDPRSKSGAMESVRYLYPKNPMPRCNFLNPAVRPQGRRTYCGKGKSRHEKEVLTSNTSFKARKLFAMVKEAKGTWEGLTIYLIEKEKPEKLENLYRQFNESACSNILVAEPDISVEYKHVLSHQIIFSRFIVVDDINGFGMSDRTLKFYSAKKIAALPKPVLISRFLEDHHFL